MHVNTLEVSGVTAPFSCIVLVFNTIAKCKDLIDVYRERDIFAN